MKDQILSAITAVTKPWTKQRKSEERNARARLRRRQALSPSYRITIKDVAFEVMQQAYLKASSNGTLPAHVRQTMYAARGEIQEQTEKQLGDKYFTQTLLPDYLREHPTETADWDVVFDARGHFHEPHTEVIVPLGTLDVRDYLQGESKTTDDGIAVSDGKLFPTHGPANRFNAILFVEKEGFMPLFKASNLAERFDLAIMSTKGLSVTASRALVDQLCGEHDIPLLVLHDFDKVGFSIVGTLRRDTRRYRFRHRIKVIDFGLRLDDVTANDLESEEVFLSSNPGPNLRLNGATEEEIKFLRDGQRVELNALSSGQLLELIGDQAAGQRHREGDALRRGLGRGLPP